MKISLNWLSNYIETALGAEEIAGILSDLGFGCEGIENLGDDVVIDVEITSNRGDCLSYIGIARELAVVTGKELKLPKVELDESERQACEFATVQIDESDLCGRYTARIIEGIKVAPSPDWLRKRLEAIAMRSVNNVVDAANYAMVETGQPPHAFDYAKIAEGKIIVRKALAGETLISIDGSKCQLDADMLIIADTAGPIAVAGVMGGLDTEVSEKTTTILLEDAYFEPVSVRTTSRKLALPSEAAFRFERTVDIERIDWASKRTAQLIIQAAGGKLAKGLVDVYPERKPQKEVTLRLSRLKKLLGIEVPPKEVVRILSGLSFQPRRKDDSIVCVVPSWRSDVYREVDLIEEVARVYGYNKIPTERKIRIEVVPVDSRQKSAETIATYLNGCGFYETINVSFIDKAFAELFTNAAAGHLAVKDVSRKSANLLRQSLLVSLLAVLKTNLNAKNQPCRIFEIADTFVSADRQAGNLPIEETKLALVCDSDLRDLRGVIEGLIKSFDRDAEIVFEPVELVWAEVGARVVVNGVVYGQAGIISQAVRKKFDFKDTQPCGAEIDFKLLSKLQKSDVKVRPIPKYPAIERDLSVVVAENVCWADIVGSVRKKACSELEDVRFVGIYRGRGIGPGKKSVTLSLRFRDADGTLTHEMVDGFEAAIVKSLVACTAAELRIV